MPACARRASGFSILLLLAQLVGSPALAQPAPVVAPGGGAQGTIQGSVLDVVTGDPVIDAGVELVGQKKTTRTDIDGRFTFKAAPGTYQVRIYAPGYQSARITNVNVEAGKTTLADTTLSPEGEAGVEVVEVVARADRAAEATQILARQKASTVQETISAETIKKSPDSDAAEVVARVPAVTVKDDFIFVRGLGERYSSALLNMSRLPSTDPNRRVVPLDLFPADFLASLAIIKSYTPDLPGDFAGGLVDINLRSFPTEFQASIGLDLGANTSATFQDFHTYKGDAGDYFGIDTVRGLPGDFGNDPFFGVLPPAEQERLASALENIWSANTKTAPPNTGLDFTIGNSWGPFGVSFGALWKNEYEVQDPLIERIINCESCGANPVLVAQEDLVYNLSTFQTQLGGLLTAGYELGSTGRLTFRSLYNRTSEDEVYLGSGTNQNQEPVNVTRLQYTEQDLAFGQLGGEHVLPLVEIDWRTAFARTTQTIPDTRTTVYNANTDPPLFSNQSGSGTRIFFDIEERMTDSAVDFTVPFKTKLPFTDVWSGLPAKFKFGPAYTYRDRDSSLRQFQYRPTPLVPIEELTEAPEVILDPDRISEGLLTFQENTSRRDSFAATEEIIAGYGMFDLPLYRDLVRLVAGVRTEYSYIRLRTWSEEAEPATAKFNTTTILNNTNPIPGINLIVTPRADMNVRAGYSQTVSRPEFRELSPIFYPEPLGLRTTVGNPNLRQASVDNVDLRWEWFFSPLELVSASFFYKTLDRPIEQILVNFGSTFANSFANAKDGTLWGFEIEGRKSFGFLARDLEPLTLSLNVAWIDSEVELEDPVAGQTRLTTPKHPLQGQSPYVINTSLEYASESWGTARLLYVTFGERITALGYDPLPNIEEKPRNQLDFVWFDEIDVFGTPITAKLAVENMWNDRYLFKQGDFVQSRFRTGIKFGLSFTYDFS